MSDLPAALPEWLDRIWHELTRAAADRTLTMHYAAMATAGLSGGAEARMVGMRRTDRTAGNVIVWSDANAGKMAELRRDNRATLLFWDGATQQQLRLKVTVGSTPADAELWDTLPDAARFHFGRAPTPATPIGAPDAWSSAPDRSALAILTCRVDEIEALQLDDDGGKHRRARFLRSEDWHGTWLCP